MSFSPRFSSRTFVCTASNTHEAYNGANIAQRATQRAIHTYHGQTASSGRHLDGFFDAGLRDALEARIEVEMLVHRQLVKQDVVLHTKRSDMEHVSDQTA